LHSVSLRPPKNLRRRPQRERLLTGQDIGLES
jgi:hypothetical protein